MAIRIETEQTYRIKDRKIAGIIALSVLALSLVTLCFIGYRISKSSLPEQIESEEVTFIPFDPQILEHGHEGSKSSTPAKAKQAETASPQMKQILTENSSNSHVKSGNSDITNTNTPTTNPSAARHVSDNPFATGGIYDGNSFGNRNIGDDQVKDNSDFKSGENIKRYLVAKPSTNTLQSDENCKIVLSVLVDPNGNIIGNPGFVKSGSTTNNTTLINQVIGIVKSQAQFNKLTISKNMREAITIRITAS
jgi:hypothetical protein